VQTFSALGLIFKHLRPHSSPNSGRRAKGQKWLACITFWVQISTMKRSVDFDDDLAAEIDQAASLVHEKPATIIRLAVRAGLPSVTSRFQAPRPEGYFKDAYPLSDDRLALEKAMSKVVQRPER
jgi:hypothetical protein